MNSHCLILKVVQVVSFYDHLAGLFLSALGSVFFPVGHKKLMVVAEIRDGSTYAEPFA